jgi:hypothetical protein
MPSPPVDPDCHYLPPSDSSEQCNTGYDIIDAEELTEEQANQIPKDRVIRIRKPNGQILCFDGGVKDGLYTWLQSQTNPRIPPVNCRISAEDKNAITNRVERLLPASNHVVSRSRLLTNRETMNQMGVTLPQSMELEEDDDVFDDEEEPGVQDLWDRADEFKLSVRDELLAVSQMLSTHVEADSQLASFRAPVQSLQSLAERQLATIRRLRTSTTGSNMLALETLCSTLVEILYKNIDYTMNFLLQTKLMFYKDRETAEILLNNIKSSVVDGLYSVTSFIFNLRHSAHTSELDGFTGTVYEKHLQYEKSFEKNMAVLSKNVNYMLGSGDIHRKPSIASVQRPILTADSELLENVLSVQEAMHRLSQNNLLANDDDPEFSEYSGILTGKLSQVESQLQPVFVVDILRWGGDRIDMLTGIVQAVYDTMYSLNVDDLVNSETSIAEVRSIQMKLRNSVELIYANAVDAYPHDTQQEAETLIDLVLSSSRTVLNTIELAKQTEPESSSRANSNIQGNGRKRKERN